jgi:hypothetical protein
MEVTNWFWVGFWPNLAATLAGVIVGLPIALWLNRWSERASSRSRRADEAQRLKVGLLVVRAALEHNRTRLINLVQSLENNRVSFDATLDIAAWDASRDEIIPFLRSPRLHHQVAFHFGGLAALQRLCGLYLDLTAGAGAAMTGSGVDDARSQLRASLVATTKDALDQTIALSAEIDSVLAGCGNPDPL